jgi:DNA replication protein DnaC
MSPRDPISPDRIGVLRRLKLGRILDALPDRLALARQQKMAHPDLLLLVLGAEVPRHDSAAAEARACKAQLDPSMHLEHWDPTAKVTYDQALLNELTSLRFLEAHAHITIVGPVGLGNTFLGHALGHIAARRRYSVLAETVDHLLETLRHARLDHSHQAELRKRLAVDLLLIDDFGIEAMTAEESRDIYTLMTERHRRASMIVISNRGPDEWLATFADPVRAQAAIDRFTSNSYDLVIDGESYRPRQKLTFNRKRKGEA